MPTTPRLQQRYDHRLRDLVQHTGDLSIATDLGVPRSTARGWLGARPRVVVSLEMAHLTELELRQEILKLRRRVDKLAALLRLAELSPTTFRTFVHEFSSRRGDARRPLLEELMRSQQSADDRLDAVAVPPAATL